MNKNMSWKAEATSVVWMDEKTPVPVNSLPDEMVFDIQTYDRMRQEFLDLRFQLEVLQLAVSGKYNQIVVKIKNAIEVKKSQQPLGEENGTVKE